MNPLVLTLLSFVAAAMAVAAVASVLSDLFLRDRTRVSKRVDDEFRKRLRDKVERSAVFKDLGRLSAEVAGGEPPFRQRVQDWLDQAGLEATPDRLFLLVGGVAAGLGAAAGLLRQSPAAAAAGAVVGAALPPVYVRLVRAKRQEKLLSQLPDSFDLMARVIRAGQTMTQAQQAVADEFAPPIAAEFSACYEQQNLGLPPEIAMRDLARRTGLLEIQIFVTAMLVQQQTGGNLAEMLEKLAEVVRERYKIRGKVKALTAEGRYQGLVLLALPVGLYTIMLVMNYSFAVVLLDYPQLLLGIACSEAVGAFWIHKIVNFDF